MGDRRETLAQEKTSQEPQQDLIQSDDEDSLQWEGNSEEDLMVSDSLDSAGHHEDQKSPVRLEMDYLQTRMDENRSGSRRLSNDEYSDLRYDSNWRSTLKGAEHWDQSPHLSTAELANVTSSHSGGKKRTSIKGSYIHVTESNPASVVPTPPDVSYHLHAQSDRRGSASPSGRNTQPRPSVAQRSRTCSVCAQNEHGSSLQRRSSENQNTGCEAPAEKSCGHPELSDTLSSMNLQERPSCGQRDRSASQRASLQTWQKATSSLKNLKVASGKSPGSLKASVVQRNKKTLGRAAVNAGSYLKAHTLKGEIPQDGGKELTKAGGQEDGSPPKLQSLQTSQQLKVTQISRVKNAQRKQPPATTRASGVTEERGDCRPLAKLNASTHSQSGTSSQLLAPAVRLNIHVNSPSSLLPLLRQSGRDAGLHPASVEGQILWHPASELGVTFGCQRVDERPSNHMSHRDPYLELTHQQPLETTAGHWPRADCVKWPLACGEPLRRRSPDELQQPATNPSTPCSSGAFSVLPPIGDPGGDRRPDVSRGQTSTSDGYLVQREKQKQMKARVSDKKRQTLNPQVIHEHNKKTRWIPFSVSEDPEGKDKRAARMKALEYARTVPRPPARPRPRPTQKVSDGFAEHRLHLEDGSVTQLAALELLRKRHEEEKQTVTLLRKKHAV